MCVVIDIVIKTLVTENVKTLIHGYCWKKKHKMNLAINASLVKLFEI